MQYTQVYNIMTSNIEKYKEVYIRHIELYTYVIANRTTKKNKEGKLKSKDN